MQQKWLAKYGVHPGGLAKFKGHEAWVMLMFCKHIMGTNTMSKFHQQLSLCVNSLVDLASLFRENKASMDLATCQRAMELTVEALGSWQHARVGELPKNHFLVRLSRRTDPCGYFAQMDIAPRIVMLKHGSVGWGYRFRPGKLQ